MTVSRQQVIDAYFAANVGHSSSRAKVAKMVTAYNKVNKNTPLYTIDLLKEVYPSIYQYIIQNSLTPHLLLENNFRKLLQNLECKQITSLSYAGTTYPASLGSSELLSQVYGNGNARFTSPLFPNLTFTIKIVPNSYYVTFICEQNNELVLYADEAFSVLREM